MRGGELRDRISLERIQGDGDGAWLPIAATPDMWASVEPLGGDGRYRIRIRYRADLTSLRDAAPAMRVIFGDRVLDIEDVVEVVRRQEVHLFVRDVLVDTPVLSTGGHRIKGG